MPASGTFQYEVEVLNDESQKASDPGEKKTVIRCHGNLVSAAANQLAVMAKLPEFRGRVTIDLEDVKYVDSAGLGALIRLKLSAAKENVAQVQFANISPGLMTLLRISNLENWFIA